MTLPERQRFDDSARTLNFHRNAGRNLAAVEDRRIFAVCRHVEAIGEAHPELLPCQLVIVGGDAPPPVIGHHAQIIDAVGVIGVVVREQHAVEPANPDVEQLLTEIWRGVDERGRGSLPSLLLHQHRAAPAPVLWISRIARAPDISDAWHAAGRAAAEDGELEGHEAEMDTAERGTFLNRRKKFSVVALAISSSLMS